MSDSSEKPTLKPASENPWYVLMTVEGRQTGPSIDRDLHTLNRRYWNGWMAQVLSDERKQTLIDEGRVTAHEIAPLSDEERMEIKRAWMERCRTSRHLDENDCNVSLSGTRVEGWFVCSGFIFSGPAYFADSVFSGPVEFHTTVFEELAHFERCRFYRVAQFDQTTFSRGAYFREVKFCNNAEFQGSTFSGIAHFEHTTFTRDAYFTRKAFEGRAEFSGAQFHGRADFTGRAFNEPTDFARCGFHAEPPRYFNADLHEDTRWKRVNPWPLPRGDNAASRADFFIRSYERLKLLMDAQNKYHDEHMFFRLETQCREIEDPRSLNTVASRAFGWLCDYGWDFKRPAILLGLTAFWGWVVIFLGQAITYGSKAVCSSSGGSVMPGHLLPLDAAFLSLSNLFGFLGFGRVFLREEYACLTPLSEVTSMVQTIAGIPLLFFLLLALRNRFRMR